MRSRNASLKKHERNSTKSDYEHIASNFGAAPMPLVKTAVLDSVKCISDSVAIMYTSNYCSRGFHSNLDLSVEYDQQGQKVTRVYSNPRVGRLWNPGADTVYNHPLFRHRHSLDSVKAIIDRDYHFNLPADSIEFIGYDNAQGESNQNLILPSKPNQATRNSLDGWKLLLLLIVPIGSAFALMKFALPSISNSN